MKNKTTAGILAILLGWIGIHKFYLGKGGAGVFYLLFCWTLIPAIIGFFEGIMLLVMSDADFDAKYNNQNGNNLISSNADELEKLYNLKEKGIISEQEFQNKKARLM